MKLKIFTDGASRGNPGKAGAGAIIYTQSNTILEELFLYLGIKTNNEAEYLAVLLALKWMVKHNYNKAIINADSQLVVKQLKKEYRVKALKIIPLFEEIQKLIREHNLELEFNWIRRENNSYADSLANKAIDLK